jgi:hypothetical protein
MKRKKPIGSLFYKLYEVTQSYSNMVGQDAFNYANSQTELRPL